MTFFVTSYGEMSHVQCDTLDSAVMAISGVEFSRFEVSGDYIPAGELIETASYVNGVLTVPGRDVVKI